MSSTKEKEDTEKIDRLERIYLSWITNGAIFLASAPIMRTVGKNGKYYTLILLVIGIVIFAVTNIDYLQERTELTNNDIDIPLRLDLLFVIMTVVIIVMIIIGYDYSVNSEKMFDNNIKKIEKLLGIKLKNKI